MLIQKNTYLQVIKQESLQYQRQDSHKINSMSMSTAFYKSLIIVII